MISLIKRKYYHIKKFLLEPIYNDDIKDGNKNNIIIKSFINNDKILISHKNIPNEEIIIPVNTPINFNIDDIEEEINRFACIKTFVPLFEKKYIKKRLIIYQNTNNLSLGTLNYIISQNKFKEYHIFTSNIDSYNTNIYLQKKYNTVILNSIEYNNECMYRLIRNEWENTYNNIIENNKNDMIFILFSNGTSIEEILDALYWIRNCYICIPYNKFIIKLLQFLCRRILLINIEHVKYNYCILNITNDTYRYITTEKFINNIVNEYNKIKKKYFPILFPMYFPSNKK